MALYIPHSIFHLARLLYVRPETFGPYYVPVFLEHLKVPFLWNQTFHGPVKNIPPVKFFQSYVTPL